MRRIGIYGGTFNPPHLAHLISAEVIREDLGLEKIIFVPSAVPPLKVSIDARHRLAMAKLAFGGNSNFEVSEIEFENTGVKSYTVDTLSMFQKRLGEASRLFFIIGVDKLEELPKWKQPERLFELCDLIVINRPGYDLRNVKQEFLDKVSFAKIPFMEISSTEIRQRVSEGKSVRYFVKDEVGQYIRENNLYKTI